MNVSISPSLEPHFDPPAPTEGDAEAALEALRVAIGQPAEDIPAPPVPTSNRSQILSANETQQTLERALAALNQLSSTSQTIVDNMNLPSVISGLSGSLRMLVESNRRQADIVRDLVGQLSGQGECSAQWLICKTEADQGIFRPIRVVCSQPTLHQPSRSASSREQNTMR
jgi:hypothetical protein